MINSRRKWPANGPFHFFSEGSLYQPGPIPPRFFGAAFFRPFFAAALFLGAAFFAAALFLGAAFFAAAFFFGAALFAAFFFAAMAMWLVDLRH
jgi:hypothetical protein